MVRTITLMFLLNFTAQSIFSQSFSPKCYDDYPIIQNVDSLEKAVFTNRSNTTTYMHQLICLELNRYIYGSDAKQDNIEQIKALANEHNDALGKAMLPFIKYLERSQKNQAEIVKGLYESRQYFTQIKDTTALLLICNKLTRVFYEETTDITYSSSEAYDREYKELLRLGKACTKPYAKLLYYTFTLSSPLFKSNNNDIKERATSFKLALNLLNQNPRYEYIRALLYETMGGAYFNIGDFKKTLENQLIVYQLSKKLSIRYQISCCYNLANVYRENKQFDLAEQYYKEAIKLIEQREVKDLNFLFTVLRNLSSNQYEQKNYKEAAEHLTMLTDLHFDIVRDINKEKVAEAEAQYENGKKESANQLLLQEKNNLTFINKILIGGFLITSVLLSLLIIVYQRLRRKIKELDYANQELQQIGNFRERMFSIVAHDLRSPITTYSGLAEMCNYIIKNQRWSDLSKVSTQLDGISANLKNVLDNLLQWTMHYTEKKAIARMPINIATLINELLPIYQSIADFNNVYIATTMEKDFFAVVDENAFKLIFRNILDNAIKNTIEGETIKIVVQEEQNLVNLTIANRSRNIQPKIIQTIQHLFEDKINLDSDRAGLGLGLMMVKDFAKLNHATLSLIVEKEDWLIFKVEFQNH